MRYRKYNLTFNLTTFADCGEVDASIQDASLANSSMVSSSMSKGNGPIDTYKSTTTSANYGSVLSRTPDIPYSIQNDIMNEGCEAKCEW